jgi:hypothetical protein
MEAWYVDPAVHGKPKGLSLKREGGTAMALTSTIC